MVVGATVGMHTSAHAGTLVKTSFLNRRTGRAEDLVVYTNIRKHQTPHCIPVPKTVLTTPNCVPVPVQEVKTA